MTDLNIAFKIPSRTLPVPEPEYKYINPKICSTCGCTELFRIMNMLSSPLECKNGHRTNPIKIKNLTDFKKQRIFNPNSRFTFSRIN